MNLDGFEDPTRVDNFKDAYCQIDSVWISYFKYDGFEDTLFVKLMILQILLEFFFFKLAMVLADPTVKIDGFEDPTWKIDGFKDTL